MFFRGQGVALGIEHAQGGDQFGAGIARLDDVGGAYVVLHVCALATGAMSLSTRPNPGLSQLFLWSPTQKAMSAPPANQELTRFGLGYSQ